MYINELIHAYACCRGIGISVGLCCSPVAALVSEINPLATLPAHAPLDVTAPLILFKNMGSFCQISEMSSISTIL